MDKITALKSISRNLRDLIVDTIPSSMTGTSIDANKLIHPEANQLRGFTWYAYSGAGAGQERTCGSFSPTNNRIVFEEAFTTIPSTNTNFVIFKQFDKLEYDNALDRWVGRARVKNLQHKVATLALVPTQYEYLVPSGFDFISNLRLVPSGNTDYAADDKVNRITEFPPRYWGIEPNAKGSYMIIFDPRKIDLDTFENKWINVIGQVKPDIAGTDNAAIPQDLEEYLIAGASMQLASQRISEGEEWRRKFQTFKDAVNELESYIDSRRYGRKVSG